MFDKGDRGLHGTRMAMGIGSPPQWPTTTRPTTLYAARACASRCWTYISIHPSEATDKKMQF